MSEDKVEKERKLLQSITVGDEYTTGDGVTLTVAEVRTRPFPSVKLVRGAHSVIKFPSTVLSWTRLVPKPTAQEAREHALRSAVTALGEAFDDAVESGADPKLIESLAQQLRATRVKLRDTGGLPNPSLQLREEERKRLEEQVAADDASRERAIASRQLMRDGVFEWLERIIPGGNVQDQTEVQRNDPGTTGYKITGGYLIPFEDMMRLMEKVSEALEEKE